MKKQNKKRRKIILCSLIIILGIRNSNNLPSSIALKDERKNENKKCEQRN